MIRTERNGLSTPRSLSREDGLVAEVTSVELAAERCVRVLRRRPSGLFTDFDGTLSKLAATPAAARIDPTAEQALDRLQTKLDLVAIVTGRSAADAQRLVGLPELLYVGNHGLERRRGEAHIEHPAGLAASDGVTIAIFEISEAVRSKLAVDGLIFENKSLSGSIHYRLAAEPELAREVLLREARKAAIRHDLVVTEGRRIIELRPHASVNKGTAIVELMIEHRLRGALFFGDDVTDIDGFLAIRAFRADAAIVALNIGISSPESPQALVETSDLVIDGVDACAELLRLVAERLEHLSVQRQA